MALYEARCAFDTRALLGECATWSAAEGAFYFADIHGQSINRIDARTGERRIWKLPSKPGCFVLTVAGDRAIIAAREAIYDLHLDSNSLSVAAPTPYDPATHRFNDGTCDRQGRFWVGSIFADWNVLGIAAGKDKGVYYRYDGRQVVAGLSPITFANGTAFSPDGRTMYRAESMEQTIWAYDYDLETGLPTNGRLFATVPQEFGVPDGAAVDANGHYWSALPTGREGGWVLRFDPTGKTVGQYHIPTRQPTMCTFGGPELSDLYVTSMQYAGCDPLADPHAGGVFVMETDVQGLPAVPFQSRA